MQETSAGDKLGSKMETSDKTATSLENVLSPYNILFSFYFLLKGDKETSKIETTEYEGKGENRHIRGRLGIWKHKHQQNGFSLSLVSSSAFRGAAA